MKIDYKGSEVFYNCEGEGNTLVFLHGFLEKSTMWNGIINKLKESYRCINIDLPGHGLSEIVGEISTMELMADAVAAVLAHLEVQRSIIIGHSMGGYVALALAESKPFLFDGLCLMNSTPFEDSIERKHLRDRAIKIMKRDKRTFISISISNLFASENILKYNNEINQLKKEAYNMSIPAIEATLMGMKNRPDRASIFKNLDCKKLMIMGERDNLIDSEQHRAAFGKYSEIKVLKGGHMLHIENTSEIYYIISRFIEK